MAITDSLLIWVHLLSASIWVGGSIFIGVVLAPMLKFLAETNEERIILMIKIGRRFNSIAVPALVVLVATGVYNANTYIASPNTILDSTYGKLLVIKITLVASMIAVFGIHIKISGRNIEQELNARSQSSDVINRLRTRIIWFGRIIVGQSVTILLLAAILQSGV